MITVYSSPGKTITPSSRLPGKYHADVVVYTKNLKKRYTAHELVDALEEEATIRLKKFSKELEARKVFFIVVQIAH